VNKVTKINNFVLFFDGNRDKYLEMVDHSKHQFSIEYKPFNNYNIKSIEKYDLIIISLINNIRGLDLMQNLRNSEVPLLALIEGNTQKKSI